MDKFINKQGFMVEIFDHEQEAEQAGEIGDAILAARSLRLTEIDGELGHGVSYAVSGSSHPVWPDHVFIQDHRPAC
jgi:hypothetical protein